VLADLERYGRVRLYHDHPNEEEAAKEKEHIMGGHWEMLDVVRAMESRLLERQPAEAVMDVEQDRGKEKEEAMDVVHEKEENKPADAQAPHVATHEGYTAGRLEREYERWVELDEPNGQLIWMGTDDFDSGKKKIHFLLDDKEFSLIYPTAEVFHSLSLRVPLSQLSF
jgi:hypothetical protein